MTADEGKTSTIHPYKYYVREFTPEGEDLRQIQGSSEKYVRIDPDGRFSDHDSYQKNVKSIIFSLAVSDDMIFVHFSSDKMYLDIYDMVGKRLNQASIVIPEDDPVLRPFMLQAVEDKGYFYDSYLPRPETIDVNNPPNPIVVQFRLKQQKGIHWIRLTIQSRNTFFSLPEAECLSTRNAQQEKVNVCLAKTARVMLLV